MSAKETKVEEAASNETLAEELRRLVREYETAVENNDNETVDEAWALIADFAVCNADAICAALTPDKRDER